jgi:hypothetical protein
MRPSIWKGMMEREPARFEWTSKEEALVRAMGIHGQLFFPVDCETPDLLAWKAAPLADSEEIELSLEDVTGIAKKRWREPGNDAIWISPDFDAPLSPEEEE